ncbi:MAG: type II toxin-antitoxin system RelE family toxin [Beijerinckiaceae bacterium]
MSGHRWEIQFTPQARKQLAALTSVEQKRILSFLFERLQGIDDPKSLAKRLVGSGPPLWRYRVGDFRIIVTFEDGKIIVLAQIAHRREVYR